MSIRFILSSNYYSIDYKNKIRDIIINKFYGDDWKRLNYDNYGNIYVDYYVSSTGSLLYLGDYPGIVNKDYSDNGTTVYHLMTISGVEQTLGVYQLMLCTFKPCIESTWGVYITNKTLKNITIDDLSWISKTQEHNQPSGLLHYCKRSRVWKAKYCNPNNKCYTLGKFKRKDCAEAAINAIATIEKKVADDHNIANIKKIESLRKRRMHKYDRQIILQLLEYEIDILSLKSEEIFEEILDMEYNIEKIDDQLDILKSAISDDSDNASELQSVSSDDELNIIFSD